MGYDLNSIKNSLLQSGYTSQQVNAAIDYISAQQQHQGTNTKSWSQTTTTSPNNSKIFMILGVLLVLAIGVGIFAILPDSTAKQPYVQPPNPSTQPSYNEPDEIPEMPENPRTPQLDEIQRQPVIPVQTVNRNTNTRLSRLEIDETVSEIAATKPDEAIELCNQIITRAGTFTCVTKVAVESQDYQYCQNINDVSAKDTCFMNFALNEIGDEAVCQKIANEYKKESCFNLYDIQAQLAQIENVPQLTDEEITRAIAAAELSKPTDEELREAATVEFGATEEDFLVDGSSV